jgi:hypothetical protein
VSSKSSQRPEADVRTFERRNSRISNGRSDVEREIAALERRLHEVEAELARLKGLRDKARTRS